MMRRQNAIGREDKRPRAATLFFPFLIIRKSVKNPSILIVIVRIFVIHITRRGRPRTMGLWLPM